MTIRSKRGDNVTPEEHKLVVRFAKQCLKEICKKQYEIHNGATGKLTYQHALTQLRIETKYRGQRSYGNNRRISIDVGDYRRSCTSFHEYDSFANDAVIGTIKFCDDRELLLKCLVTHEVAHHIQSRYGRYTRYLKKTYRKPHGDEFKTIYRELRRTLVNPFIEPTQEVA